MKRSSHKRTSKISEAVFRGNRRLYSFEVFPLTAKDISDAPGVFIISRRRVDRFGSGHHNAVCVGETGSILAEIRHHKRAKCVKTTAANVVCFLKEERPETRAGVVEDLVSSRTFACVRNEIRTAISPLPAIVEFKPEKPRRRVRPVEPTSENAAGETTKSAKTKRKAAKKVTAKATKSRPNPAASALKEKTSASLGRPSAKTKNSAKPKSNRVARSASKKPSRGLSPKAGKHRPTKNTPKPKRAPLATVAKSKTISRKPASRKTTAKKRAA